MWRNNSNIINLEIFKIIFLFFLLSYFHWQELSHAHDYAINYWAPLWFSVWDML